MQGPNRSKCYLCVCVCVTGVFGACRKPKSQEVLWSYSVDCLRSHVNENLLKDVQLDAEVLKDILGQGKDKD